MRHFRAPVRESKLLVGTTFLLKKKEKVYLKDCEKQRALRFCRSEKTWCWLAVIPVLVFDCVALQYREGISGFCISFFTLARAVIEN